MNAIELLVHDHETVKKLLNELSETTERALKKRSELLHGWERAVERAKGWNENP